LVPVVVASVVLVPVTVVFLVVVASVVVAVAVPPVVDEAAVEQVIELGRSVTPPRAQMFLATFRVAVIGIVRQCLYRQEVCGGYTYCPGRPGSIS
jgi:hypothetical protein